MQRQMDDLSAAAERLPTNESPELRAQIEALRSQLDLALRGQAENGWSNAEIVHTVGALCGDVDLIEWTVQP